MVYTMNETIQTQKIYVTMTDKFMSGWGKANGLIDKLVIVCDSEQEAEIVADNARHRSEMKNVSIRYSFPNYDPDKYKTDIHGRTENPDYGTWFKPNAFRSVRN